MLMILMSIWSKFALLPLSNLTASFSPRGRTQHTSSNKNRNEEKTTFRTTSHKLRRKPQHPLERDSWLVLKSSIFLVVNTHLFSSHVAQFFLSFSSSCLALNADLLLQEIFWLFETWRRSQRKKKQPAKPGINCNEQNSFFIVHYLLNIQYMTRPLSLTLGSLTCIPSDLPNSSPLSVLS